jgi:hypothetical protein
MRNSLDNYFVLNWLGFKNISRMISHGDSVPCQQLCTELTASQRRSRHFNMHTAWVRDHVDNGIVSQYHTPTTELTANALTKRVASDEQQWAIDASRNETPCHLCIQCDTRYILYIFSYTCPVNAFTCSIHVAT